MQSSVLYFGGRYRNQGQWTAIDVVARYANDEWNQIGKLKQPRDSHRSIQIDRKIFVIGGSLR